MTGFVAFSSTSGKFFLISSFILDGIFSNKGQSKQKIKLFVVVSALFCNLFWFSRTFGECFSSKFMHCPVDPDWQQYHSSNVLENEIRSQNSAYTVRKSFTFCVLCTLFPQLLFDMNRDILKNPTEVELKIVTNSVYFVMSFGHMDSPQCIWISTLKPVLVSSVRVFHRYSWIFHKYSSMQIWQGWGRTSNIQIMPETNNCPSWISRSQNGENDYIKYFMINLHDRILQG